MARTKKFLGSSSGNGKNRIGFYRPISRMKPIPPKKPGVQPQKTLPTKTNEEVEKLLKELELIKQQNSQLKLKTEKNNEIIQQPTQIKDNKNKQTSLQNQVDKPKLNTEDSPKRKEERETIEDIKEKQIPKFNIDWQSIEDIKNSETQQTNNDGESEEYKFDDKNKIERKLELLEKELRASIRRERKHKEEIKKLRETFDNQKKKMSQKVTSLIKEVEHQTPVTQNKFFTISSRLHEVAQAMDMLIQQTPELAEAVTPQTELTKQDVVIQTDTQPIPADQPSNPKTKDEQPKQKLKDEKSEKSKKSKVPKPIIILGSTLTLVLLIGGALWFSFTRETEVSTELIQEYLPQDSAQQVIQNEDIKKKTIIKDDISKNSDQENIATDSGEVEGASTQNKYEQSQADVPFSETQWEEYNDPVFKISMTYPINAVNMVRTDTSTTFIRKTGYIFKIQVVDTALDLENYWKLIKSGGLKYKVTETEFRGEKALFLELEDLSDYPGDKYLVQIGEKIYEIWYATPSQSLSEDDSKRVDIMLNSFKFTYDKSENSDSKKDDKK